VNLANLYIGIRGNADVNESVLKDALNRRSKELEDEVIANYIMNSEYFEMFQDTPKDLQYPLSKLLYYRYLQMSKSDKIVDGV